MACGWAAVAAGGGGGTVAWPHGYPTASDFGAGGKVLDDFGSEGFFQGVRNYPGSRLVAGASVRQSGSDFNPGAARYLAG